MYFDNNTNDTNIASQFKEKNNILLSFIKIFSKYKMIFIISIVVTVLLILMLILFTNRKVNNYLILNGEEIVTIYQGSDYVEPGYNAYNSKNADLTSSVVIESNLNNDVVGEYEIVYTIGDVTQTRIVKVISKPQEYIFIHLTSVNSKVDIYLQKGEKYTEPGYLALSSTGEDLTDKVKVNGNVDTSKKGTYKLTYSVIDRYGVTISVSRKVIVMDSDISLTLSTGGYTNKEVTISVFVVDEYFDYMILPDNTKVITNTYSYKVSSNGIYTFKVYNKKGNSKEGSIVVKNIDKTTPSGSCSGSYKDGVSTINLTTSDNIGIDRYEINGNKYTSKEITINSEMESVDITIYDKAGNSKKISCTLEDKNELELFGDITLKYQYVSDGQMPYALYTPNVDNKGEDIPLIVWLHGSAEVSGGEAALQASTFLSVLSNWKLEGFNAYVLCPQLRGGKWADSYKKDYLFSLLDKIVEEYNVDKSKIIIAGHSLGAIGAQYMVYYRRNYFSSMVVLSGYHPLVNVSEISGIPTKGYVGSPAYGEQTTSYNYMVGVFSNIFGSSKVTVLKTSHSGIVGEAFRKDSNNDGRSDLIEWMLSQ